jgi:hypothetical protein
MTCLKKAACLLLTAAMCACAGCSDKNNNDNNSSSANSADKSTSSQETQSKADSQSAQDDSSQTEETQYKPGENLEKTVQRFSGSYTYKAEVQYSDEKSSTEITQVSDGEKFYQRSVEKDSTGINADTAYIFDGENAYDIDYNFNAYAECSQKTELNLFCEIYDSQLEQTDTHIPDDAEGYDIEEYTYTGDTYIAVYDLYFKDGEISKYTSTFSVEGQDDLIVTVTVQSVEDEADETVFDGSALDKLSDFTSMNEDTRLGFCQGVCAARQITTDEMAEMNITADDLKTISFDSFRELVYTYAGS